MIFEDLELTTSQAELLPKIKAFLDSKERIFLLTGKPGVGKTTMVRYILKDHIAADKNSGSFYNMNVAGITLSHQAKNVLGNHIPHVFTFAKAFGLKESIDEVTGRKTFVYDKWAYEAVGKKDIPVFVHDEVSQYTEEMLQYVMENTPMFSKIIFIGDRAQLPPIDPENKLGRDADSPIFSWNIPDSCKHELTERVRQAEGNPILDLSDVIREEIFGLQRIDKVIDMIRKPKMESGIGYGFVRYNDLLSHIEDKDILKTRLLAYRNKTINKHNPLIRNHLLDNPRDLLVDGDIVTMTENYYHFPPGGDVRPDYVLYNSETFRLSRVYSSVQRKEVNGENYAFDVYNGEIEDRKEIFVTPTETGALHFDRMLSSIAEKCRFQKPQWMWAEHFWPTKGSVCEFTYGYASSIYKAQGSTYDTIYLDINDVLLTRPITPKRKLQAIYTAITRAKNDVYFLKS